MSRERKWGVQPRAMVSVPVMRKRVAGQKQRMCRPGRGRRRQGENGVISKINREEPVKREAEEQDGRAE